MSLDQQTTIDTTRSFYTRPGSPEDRTQIETVWRGFSEPDEGVLDVALDEDHEHHEFNRVFVADSGDRVIGFGVVVRCGQEWLEGCLETEALSHRFDSTNGCFHTLAVRPEWRGQGVGTQLGRHRLEWLRSHDVSHVFGVGWLREDGPSSAPVFERLGFEVLARIEEFYYRDQQPRRWCPDCGEPCECAARIYGRTP